MPRMHKWLNARYGVVYDRLATCFLFSKISFWGDVFGFVQGELQR
jgi:hypothetical protein